MNVISQKRQGKAHHQSLGDNRNTIVTGIWRVEEAEQYLEFVRDHQELLTASNTRRMKAFKVMAEVITTRTALQCRSHHQKMLKKP